jgi:putative SOS response-associated peptidase YedK
VCGRFTLHTPREVLAARFGVDLSALGAIEPRYNVAPSQSILAVSIDREANRQGGWMRWGLIPHWADRRGDLPTMINARVETAPTRRAFRDAFRRRRCLIPADGFYEWEPTAGERPGPKQPWWIALRDGGPFAMAGLWERWTPREELFPETVTSCSILTTAASPAIASIHDRMPILLRPEAEEAWLDPRLDGETERLLALLEPPPDEALRARPVSLLVNSTTNDGPALIEESKLPQLGF